MKKSKFLLLGSVASLASIPFVAAKCGETKEEKKPETPNPDKKPGGDKNPGTDKKPEENKTPEEDKEPSDEELSKEWKSEEETEVALTKEEEKLIKDNIKNGITTDKNKNHIWGEDDEQGSRTNSGTKVQNPGANSGTTTQPSDTTKPAKPANNPMVRTDGNTSENSEAIDDIRWKGVTPEDKKRAKESGEFWAEYWGLK